VPGTLIARDGFEIVPPGEVLFRAGERIIMQDGFRAHTGSVYRTEIDPALAIVD